MLLSPLRLLFCLALSVVGSCLSFAVTETFDTYATNSAIIGQGGWKGWDNSSFTNANVVSTVATSNPNSLRITGTSDVVKTYSGFNSGKWVYRAMQYVNSASIGNTYFVLMNRYVVGDHPSSDWSVQLQANAADHTLKSMETGAVVPLIENSWAEIRCEVDLNLNHVDIFYNGHYMISHAWYTGGQASIQAVELLSESETALAYYDDLSLNVGSPPEILSPLSESILIGSTNGNGNLSSWSATDGDVRTICKFFVPTVTSPFIRTNLNFSTSKLAPTAISFDVRVANEPAGIQQLSLKLQNKVSGAFVATDVSGVNTAPNTTFFGAASGALSSYVGNGGAMTGQIEVKAVGFQAVAVPCIGFDSGILVVSG